MISPGPSTTGPRRRCAIRASGAIAVLGVVAVLAGCGYLEDDDSTAPVGNSCAALVDRAADAVEIRDQVDLLDTALVVCRSVGTFEAQLARYPGLIGYDTLTYARNRCESAELDSVDGSPTTDEPDAIADSAICHEVAIPTTTTTLPPPPQIEYVGQTLDGREVVIRPNGVTPFVDGKPAPIVQIVDIANEDGCAGVEEELERWTAAAEDPSLGDEASVYAQHAKNVMVLYDC